MCDESGHTKFSFFSYLEHATLLTLAQSLLSIFAQAGSGSPLLYPNYHFRQAAAQSARITFKEEPRTGPIHI